MRISIVQVAQQILYCDARNLETINEASGAEASRKIAENAVKLDGEPASNALILLPSLPARLAVRLGKRAKVAIIH
jgi:hypothetical protein